MSELIVLLEDTREANDILKYCNENNIKCKEMTVDELYSVENFLNCTYFCNTEIVQHHLKRAQRAHGSYLYQKFYTLIYFVLKIFDINIKDLPLFIKPITNDKNFTGQVVTNISDLSDIYTSDIVKFETKNYMVVVEWEDHMIEKYVIIL